MRVRVLRVRTVSELASLLSDRRLDLVRHLARTPEPTIRQLARSLGRDFKNVHGDLRALEDAGLVRVDRHGMWVAAADTAVARIRLR